jgi:hypothetical protein
VAFAAVQRVGKAADSASSLTIGAGDGWATPATGSLLVVAANGDALVSTPSGYTAGPSVVDDNAVYFFWKIADGTESSVTIGASGSTGLMATAAEYSGALASPFDASNSSTITGSNGTTTTSTSLTTAAAGDLVVAVAGIYLFNASTTAPVGVAWTNSFTGWLSPTATNPTGNRGALLYADQVVGAAGSYATAASWSSPQYNSRQELIIAFKAAAVTATSTTAAQIVSAPAPQARGQAKLLRSTLIDPPVLVTPQPLVVSASPRPPAALALAARSSLFDATTPAPLLIAPAAPVRQGVQIVKRGALADDPVLTTPPPLLASPRYQPPPPVAIVARSSLVDVVVASASTPQPLVVTSPAPLRQGAQLIERGSLADDPVLTTPPPLVVSPPYRPPAGEALLSRSSLFDTLTTAGPLVVGSPVRPGRPLFVSLRSSLADVITPAATFTAAPLVITAPPARAQAVRTVIVAGAADCDCTVHRPFTGTLARPSSGVVARPSTGVVQRPCVC